MECTQRIECTQDLSGSPSERLHPEQIGFLGICGTKYPVKKGPNKIGRDPQTCDIVLNLNSISRQHAVINILNGKNFMLMDLDSANKTKLSGKTLPAYIPHQLRNGDMVQFGQVFGVFRLLDDENDLPMTQAVDLPETPVINRHASRINNVPSTTIPESPDVSDRDDSFIKASQTNEDHLFKSPSNKFIKPSGKTISIQPIGTNKIDNVFWNISNKSKSLNLDLDDSSGNLDDSTLSVKTDNTLVNQNKTEDIHDMETQVPFRNNQNHQNESAESIYTAETQIPVEVNASLRVHSLETQRPDVRNIGNEEDSQLYFYSTNKENNLSLYNAETQLPSDAQNKNNIDLDTDLFEAETQVPIMKNKLYTSAELKTDFISPNIYDAATQIPTSGIMSNPVEDDDDMIDRQTTTKEERNIEVKVETNLKNNINKSDDIIVFDEVDAQCFEENFDSQPLLPLSSSLNDVKENSERKLADDKKEIKANMPSKRSIRITSDSSTDCEDFNIIAPQKLVDKSLNDDLTDCEDELSQIDLKKTTLDEDFNTQNCLDDGDFNILPTQKLPVNSVIEDFMDSNEIHETKRNDFGIKDQITKDFEDQPTQVLTDIISKPSNTEILIGTNKNPAFEDMLTQVLVEDQPEKDTNIEDLQTQVLDDNVSTTVRDKVSSQPVFSEEIINPFKVPLPTPKKVKKKDNQKRNEPTNSFRYKDDDEEEKYYAATQEIFEDLCSQRDLSPEIVKTKRSGKNEMDTINTCHIYNLDKEILLTSNETKEKENKALPINENYGDNSDKDNIDEEVTNFVKSLTSKEIKEVIGVPIPTSDNTPENLKRMPSDPSDVDSTPKKVRPFKLMETDLPNSQEIKTSVSRKSLYTDSSSESDPDNETQEENTPILFRTKKRNHKRDAKIDLTKTFEATALPSRIITRVRKPTSKVQEADAVTKKNNQNILKPKFLTEDDNIDTEILTENITRLKNKNDKKNKSEISKLGDIKKQSISKSSDMKPKIIDEVKSDHINESKEKANDRKLRITNEMKSDPKDESKLKKITNDKKPQQKSRQRTKKNHSREEINIENSKALDETTVSKVNETIISTSNNETLDETTRSTRHSNRSKNNSRSGKKSDTPEKETNRRKIKVKVKLKDEDSSPKKEIRRSRRKRTTKSKNETVDTVEKPKTVNKNAEKKPQSILKNSKFLDNHSIVYNISSESSTESPKSLKRSAMADMDVPSPKRTRSCRSSNTSSLRSTPARGVQTQFVLFTAFPSEEVKLKLEALGAVLVTDVKECTVVLTMQIKRTFKLLCAVGLGKPIVGPSWVQACVENNVIVDPWLYLIKDEATEKRFQFSLERTLCGKRNFLKGFNVSCTPSVMPNEAEMKLIVECSGGTWKAQKPQWVCVSCSADKSQWDALRHQGAIIVSTEFILSGVLRQRADIKNNRLDVLK